MFMDCIRKQIYQCAQYKLKIVFKTRKQKLQDKHFFKEKIKILDFSAVVLEDLSTDISITAIGLTLTKLW